MSRKFMGLVLVTVLILAAAPGAFAQKVTTVTIDVENITTYIQDADFADLAATPELTQVIPKTFSTLVGIGDIVAVNDEPARGTWTVFTALEILAPFEAPGVAIADIARGGIATTVHEIQDVEGNPVGTIVAAGMAGGPAPPLSPKAQQFGNLAIVGGTGVYFGIRGSGGETTNPTDSFRFASSAEDPSLRRQLGGGSLRFIFTVIVPTADEQVAFRLFLDRDAAENGGE